MRVDAAMRASASDALVPADASAALSASTSSEPLPVMAGRKSHPPSPSNDYLGHRGHLTEALRAPDGRPPARSRSDPSPAEPPRQHRDMGGIVTAPASLAGAAPTIIGTNPPVSATATADCTCAPRTEPHRPSSAPTRRFRRRRRRTVPALPAPDFSASSDISDRLHQSLRVHPNGLCLQAWCRSSCGHW